MWDECCARAVVAAYCWRCLLGSAGGGVYDPDGNPTTTGSGATTNLLFAGGHQLNNVYHYDPATATWTQQDPINQITSLAQANHYTYTGGNPIDNVDLNGQQGSPCKGGEPSPAARANNKAITRSFCRLYQASSGGESASGKVIASEGAGCFVVGIVGTPVAGTLCGGAVTVAGLIDAFL